MNWTPDLLSWLNTEEGRNLLKETESLPSNTLTRLTHLRKRLPAETANALIETLTLRTKAKERFIHAEKMLFTRPGLEQATGEVMARYHAQRLQHAGTVLDACCGLGGDALALLKLGRVLAVERDPITLTCLKTNAENLLPERVHDLATLCADVTQLPLQHLRDSGVNAVLFDPARRITTATGESRRARNTEDYTPPLSFLEPLRTLFPSVCVKLSPATEEATLQRYAGEAEIELLSTSGECREALLWFGEAKEPKGMPLFRAGEFSYRATLVQANGETRSLLPVPCEEPSYVEPQAWLYEPDPAIIRAHLVAQLATQSGINLITPNIAYMTSSEPLDIPFTKTYRILATLPYRPNAIRQWLQAQGRTLDTVKKRGVALEPEKVLKEFRTKKREGTPITLVLMPYFEKTIAILCEPPQGKSF